MANPGHDFRVVVLLNAEEFIAMKSGADEEGLSQSAFIRGLVRRNARDRAMAEVSRQAVEVEMQEPAQVLAKSF